MSTISNLYNKYLNDLSKDGWNYCNYTYWHSKHGTISFRIDSFPDNCGIGVIGYIEMSSWIHKEKCLEALDKVIDVLCCYSLQFASMQKVGQKEIIDFLEKIGFKQIPELEFNNSNSDNDIVCLFRKRFRNEKITKEN